MARKNSKKNYTPMYRKSGHRKAGESAFKGWKKYNPKSDMPNLLKKSRTKKQAVASSGGLGCLLPIIISILIIVIIVMLIV